MSLLPDLRQITISNSTLKSFIDYNYNQITHEAHILILRYLNEDWLGAGRGRVAFRRKNYVVKIPYTTGGEGFNRMEAHSYKNYNAQGRLARCRMHGIMLVMEYIEQIEDHDGLPPWVEYIDCEQVGYTRTGKLVAYDYGG